MDFQTLLRSYLTIGDRAIRFRAAGPTLLFINYYNLPESVAALKAGGGAEAENNRLMLMVEQKGDKLKVELSVPFAGGGRPLRAKTGTPDQIARYVAAYINAIHAEVPPNFTHTRSNPRGSSVAANEHHVTELTLYIENEYDLVGREGCLGKTISKNLARTVVQGKYDHAMAVKSWRHLADAGAQAYTREFDGRTATSFGAFSAADRQAVAQGLADAWYAEVKVGGIDVQEEAGFAAGSKYRK